MTYELNRLGSVRFEELVQSLVKGIEPSVIIYGKGPDGQRECTCRDAHFEVLDGKYAHGYTVGQAKFKDPDGKEKDWEWLRKNLKAELDGFRAKKESGSSKIPYSYLFFTNIVLTPKESTGLRDKAEEFINEYRAMIPNILIFGADDIRAMLENNRDVAQAYKEFILPGDVLSEMQERMRSSKTEDIRDGIRLEVIAPCSSNLESLSFYKVRQLTDNLWVNWETGRLANDCDSVWKKDDDAKDITEYGVDDIVIDHTDDDAEDDADDSNNNDVEDSIDNNVEDEIDDSIEEGKRRLSLSQLRLLSILVQGEGAMVSWKELFWRGKMLPIWREQIYEAWRRKGIDSITEKERQEEIDQIWRRIPDDEELKAMAKKIVGRLCHDFPCLASIIYHSPDDKGCGVRLLEERFTDTGRTCPDLYKLYDGCSEDEDWERLSNTTTSEKIKTDSGFVYFCRDKAAWLRRYYNKTCRSFETRISNARGNSDATELKEERKKEGKIFGDYTMAQVYMNAYAKQDGTNHENDNNVGDNTRNNSTNRQNDNITEYNAANRQNDDKVGVNATNATVSDGATVNDKPVNAPRSKDILVGGQGTEPEAILDVVEDWFLDLVKDGADSHGGEDERYGHVLVLHGQPGDGKTTFCKKAVYAHCKEGWLKEVPHILLFSLNPADSEPVKGGKLNLSDVLCVTDGDEDRYYCNLKDKEIKNELKGALLILDGYDELSGDLANIEGANSFNGFCNKVEAFAKKHEWNVVITSRTMCIESELKTGAFGESAKRRVVEFAPMSEEQQEAMIDRMIQLDGSETNKSVVIGEIATSQADVSSEQHLTLEDYKEKYLRPVWENKTKDDKIDDFKELLKVPTLFRMIVARRFTDFERTKNVAELYGRLFHSLLSYKAANDDKKVKLVKKYEDFAIRIFNYDNDTCPFTGEEAKDKDLLYLFYTKKGREDKETGAEGRLGFLHRLFFQYFLARYIVSVLRKRKMSAEGGTSGEVKDVEKLFTELRVEKLADPDLWKLVSQLTEMEQDRRNYSEFSQNGEDKHNLLYHSYSKRIRKTHIEEALRFLNNERRVLTAMLSDISLTRSSRRVGHNSLEEDERPVDNKSGEEELSNWEIGKEPGGEPASNHNPTDVISHEIRVSEKHPVSLMREAENAIFNLLSACAAAENGFKPRENDRIAYANYPEVCELLHRGDYSFIYLEGANLDHCHLENAKLRNARLARVHLNHAVLSGADFSGADLVEASMQHANLKRANFAKANLDKAHLECAMGNELSELVKYYNLSMSKSIVLDAGASGLFNVSGVSRVSFADTNADKGDSHVEQHSDGVKGSDISQSSTSLSVLFRDGVSFAGASLKEAHFGDPDFGGAYLAWAVFDGADLREAHFEKAILIGASFIEADLRKAWFNDKARVSSPGTSARADMTGANFSGANLENAQMEGVNLTMVNLENALLAGANLTEAHMDRANLKAASLEEVDLCGAKLTNAKLDEAYLKWAKMDEKTLKGLEGASLKAAYFDDEQMEYAASIGINDLEKRIKRGGRWEGIIAASQGKAEKESSALQSKSVGMTYTMRKKKEETMRSDASGCEDKDIRIGDIIEFGRYPQEHALSNGNFAQEPLYWRVLKVDRENGRVLVITEKLIDCMKYHHVDEDITWEYCTLRKWMNTELIREAFTTEELSHIAWVWNENEDNQDSWKGQPVEGGNATRDRIFALSTKEVREYFKFDMDRRAAVTLYAKIGGVESGKYKTEKGERIGRWWLRSIGSFRGSAVRVSSNDVVHDHGYSVDDSGVYVRPALWLNL